MLPLCSRYQISLKPASMLDSMLYVHGVPVGLRFLSRKKTETNTKKGPAGPLALFQLCIYATALPRIGTTSAPLRSLSR